MQMTRSRQAGQSCVRLILTAASMYETVMALLSLATIEKTGGRVQNLVGMVLQGMDEHAHGKKLCVCGNDEHMLVN